MMRRLAGIVVVLMGVAVSVQSCSSSSGGHAAGVAALKQLLDHVPRPAGTQLVHETATEQHGDVNATVEREYRLPSGSATASIRAALDGAHYQFVDPHTKQPDPAAFAANSTPTTGDVYVLPPGRSGDGIEVNWNGTRLFLSVQAGQVR